MISERWGEGGGGRRTTDATLRISFVFSAPPHITQISFLHGNTSESLPIYTFLQGLNFVFSILRDFLVRSLSGGSASEAGLRFHRSGRGCCKTNRYVQVGGRAGGRGGCVLCGAVSVSFLTYKWSMLAMVTHKNFLWWCRKSKSVSGSRSP